MTTENWVALSTEIPSSEEGMLVETGATVMFAV
jgi:hypothetical protein